MIENHYFIYYNKHLFQNIIPIPFEIFNVMNEKLIFALNQRAETIQSSPYNYEEILSYHASENFNEKEIEKLKHKLKVQKHTYI